MTLTVGSLFSGIGGIDLGLERTGMTVLWQSEIEPYACRVLKKHWPTVPNLGDIRTIEWETVPYVDVIAGGYPCQPFSLLGDRRGADDPRHLWPCFADAIRRVRPRYALLENVASHLTLGFGAVLADLAALGYDAEWDCVPAASVGAPHLRDRVFVIASRRDDPHTDRNGEPRLAEHGEMEWLLPWESPMADPHCKRCQREQDPNPRRQDSDGQGLSDHCSYSRPGRWASSAGVRRVAHGIPHRLDRLRALGNAVVPQVAEHLGHLLLDRAGVNS